MPSDSVRCSACGAAVIVATHSGLGLLMMEPTRKGVLHRCEGTIGGYAAPQVVTQPAPGDPGGVAKVRRRKGERPCPRCRTLVLKKKGDSRLLELDGRFPHICSHSLGSIAREEQARNADLTEATRHRPSSAAPRNSPRMLDIKAPGHDHPTSGCTCGGIGCYSCEH